MKDFQAVPGRLRALPWGGKILYSAFAVATLVGLLVSARLYRVAVGDAGAAVYYAGAAVSSTSQASPAPAAAAPAIELAPEDTQPHALVEPMPDRKLLEVTHFHLFTIPVYVLVLAHLWLLARIPPWAQHTGVVAAVLTSALHVAAPWIVRGRPALSFLMATSGLAMLVTLGVLALGAMIDMWLPNPPSKLPVGAPGIAEKLAEIRRHRAGRSSPE